VLADWRPDGLTQLTVIVSPGRSLPRMAVRLAGELAGARLTVVITDPPVIPAAAAGMPQMVPSTRVPELTGAIEAATVTLVLPV
jgi:hypothetical protein